MPVKVIVGCCGFPAARDKYYGEFRAVEVQQTFYQPPRPALAERWRAQAPPQFEFTLKAWQLITHPPSSPTYRRLKEPVDPAERPLCGYFQPTEPVMRAWERTVEIARLLRADKIVFQTPASFTPTEENKANLRRFFRSIDRRGLCCIWEPRGEWKADEVQAICEELELVHCVDPFKARSTTKGLTYWRLHGIGGYNYEYSSEELARLSAQIPSRGTVYCMFNNTAMWKNARRFRELLADRPFITVI